MYSWKCKRFLFFSICFLIISCVAIDDSRNFWYRHNKRSTYFKKNYKSIDHIKINSFVLCKKQNKIEGRRYKTEANLTILTKNIKKNIIEELKKYFINVSHKEKEDSFINYNCGFLNKGNILSGKYKPYMKTNDGYNADITFEILTNSYRDHYKDGFYGGIDLLDQDKYDIQFIIRIALFDKNELIYLNSYQHYAPIISEIDRDVEYQMPNGVVDSLVNKSLMEYNKRLERNLK